MGKDAFTKLVQLGYVSGPVKYFSGQMRFLIYHPSDALGQSGSDNASYEFVDYGNGQAVLALTIYLPSGGTAESIRIELPIRFLSGISVPGLMSIYPEDQEEASGTVGITLDDDELNLTDSLSCNRQRLMIVFNISSLPEALKYQYVKRVPVLEEDSESG